MSDNLSVQHERDENAPLIALHKEGDHAKRDGLSYLGVASLMVAQMLGVGLLSTPVATAQSGWLGMGLALVAYGLAWLNANLLTSIMLALRAEGLVVRDYPSVGERVCGRFGKIVTYAAQYVLLCGASIIFLVLIGQFLNGIVCFFPSRFFMLVAAVLTLVIVIILPALKKAKPIAIFAVLTMWSSCAIIVVLSIIFLATKECSAGCPTCHTDVVLPSIGNGFSAYAFAFSVHASIPNFFSEMRNQKDMMKANGIAFTSAFFLFAVPLCVFSYAAYGSGMLHVSGTVLDAIVLYTPQFSTAVIATRAILVGHLIFALPIILTPVCHLVERIVLSKHHVVGTRSPAMILVRTGLVAMLTLVAMLLPYFQPLMSIVSDVAVVALIYVFPPLFWWRMNSAALSECTKRNVFTKIGLCLIVLYGCAGSGFGLQISIPALINAIQEGGNPFANFFHFGCTLVANKTTSAINATGC